MLKLNRKSNQDGKKESSRSKRNTPRNINSEFPFFSVYSYNIMKGNGWGRVNSTKELLKPRGCKIVEISDTTPHRVEQILSSRYRRNNEGRARSRIRDKLASPGGFGRVVVEMNGEPSRYVELVVEKWGVGGIERITSCSILIK
jgi:hypothetical protein